jgi:hypothetical protein
MSVAPHAAATTASAATKNQAVRMNLQTALTGVRTYYTQNFQSFSGLDPSTFAAVDTGLTAVAGNVAATKLGEVSLFVSSTGSTAIMAAWGAAKACWAIIEMTDSSTFEGFTGPATIDLLHYRAKKPTCSALSFDATSAASNVLVSPNGFPTLPSKPSNPGPPTQYLQTALTGAKTYYTQNNQSYSGLDASTFAAVDTGLVGVAGNVAAIKPGYVSIQVPTGGTVVLLAAWDGSATCLAIVDITDTTTVEGFGGPATIYVSLAQATKAECSALTFDTSTKLPNATVSTKPFP